MYMQNAIYLWTIDIVCLYVHVFELMCECNYSKIYYV